MISIVLPCFNEDAVLREAHRRLAEVADATPATPFEFIFVSLEISASRSRHRRA